MGHGGRGKGAQHGGQSRTWHGGCGRVAVVCVTRYSRCSSVNAAQGGSDKVDVAWGIFPIFYFLKTVSFVILNSILNPPPPACQLPVNWCPLCTPGQWTGRTQERRTEQPGGHSDQICTLVTVTHNNENQNRVLSYRITSYSRYY